MNAPAVLDLRDAPLHPLNDGFTWESPKGPFRRLDAEQLRQWNENG